MSEVPLYQQTEAISFWDDLASLAEVPNPGRFPANVARIRQSRPNYGIGSQAKAHITF